MNCRKKTSYKISVFKNLDDVDSSWDQYLPENHFLKTSSIRTYELATEAQPFYIFLKNQQDQLSGLVYGQVNNVDLGFVGLNILKVFSSSKGLNLIIIGNTFSTSCSGIFSQTEENIEDELLSILDLAEIAYDGVILKDYDKNLSLKDFKKFDGDYGMNLDIRPHWTGLSSYAADLDKKYRRRFEKIIKNRENLTFKLLSVAEIARNQETVNELFFNVLKNQSTQVGKIKASYFQTACTNTDYEFYGLYFEQKLVAFSILHSKNLETLDIHLVGMKYEENQKLNIYYNILFHGLEMAIAKNKKVLSLGRTALTAKASLGAIPVYKYQYYFFRNKILHFSFGFILNKLYSLQNLEQRRPFKEHLIKPNS